MSEPFTFSTWGTPRPQPRPRFTRGRVVSTADPKAKLWRLAVEKAVKQAIADSERPVPLFTGAVRLRCVFIFAPSANAQERMGQPHTLKPDASNLLKLVEDVMEDAGVFSNDSQISKVEPEKWWGTKPGVVVLVEPLEAVRPVAPIGGLVERPTWLTGRKAG